MFYVAPKRTIQMAPAICSCVGASSLPRFKWLASCDESADDHQGRSCPHVYLLLGSRFVCCDCRRGQRANELHMPCSPLDFAKPIHHSGYRLPLLRRLHGERIGELRLRCMSGQNRQAVSQSVAAMRDQRYDLLA
ncbi:hypothetical protein C770_GR4pA089 (plasmid) [Sinorhizobium meliloti GR4]|nr:hypothetical protein C770_GR4pA089 [Sinorhizobium meliloti GR4]